MKIYTKTGDNGSTSLVDGKRVQKHNLLVEAYGTVDELNTFIGLIRDNVDDSDTKANLISIQNVLFEIGSHLASDSENDKKNQSKIPELKQNSIEFLEHKIDHMNNTLAPMTHFILPGGHSVVAFCHIARTVCRRAERRVCQVYENQNINSNIIIFLNRLSDFLFVLARKLSSDLKIEEIKWIPSKNT